MTRIDDEIEIKRERRLTLDGLCAVQIPAKDARRITTLVSN